MLQSRSGILAMLDEECLRPGVVSDNTLLSKLNATCAAHRHYESRGCRKNLNDKTIPHDAFRLVHYAGTVGDQSYAKYFIYRSHNWFFRLLTKWKVSSTRTTIFCTETCLERCSSVATRFSKTSSLRVTPPRRHYADPQLQVPSLSALSMTSWRTCKTSAQTTSAVSRFDFSCDVISLHYLWCHVWSVLCVFQPNETKQSDVIDEKLVRHQVRYLG